MDIMNIMDLVELKESKDIVDPLYPKYPWGTLAPYGLVKLLKTKDFKTPEDLADLPVIPSLIDNRSGLWIKPAYQTSFAVVLPVAQKLRLRKSRKPLELSGGLPIGLSIPTSLSWLLLTPAENHSTRWTANVNI